jgi:cellulose synthase/poly-beta-1,6-N-acetylglucosamine synthase-like glycosyltransferase
MLLVVNWYWRKIPVESRPEASISDLTLVIPFRNEQEKIEQLMEQLGVLDPKLKIIMVDDHSTDNGVAEITLARLPNLQLLALTDKEGKKAAVTLGIEKSSTSNVMVTDADCWIDKSWPQYMSAGLSEYDFVYGPVRFESANTLFARMQSYELTILQVFSAATWAMGWPTMCNGANLGYKTSVFDAVGGFRNHLHVASGDDELLMHELLGAGATIGYSKPPVPLIKTSTENSVHSFINQRRRWSGKWKYYAHMPSRLLAVLIILFNAGFLAALFGFFAGYITPIEAITLFLIKGIFEYIFILGFGSYFRLEIKGLPFILLVFIYPFYVVFFGIVSHFGSYNWKGRVIAHGG